MTTTRAASAQTTEDVAALGAPTTGPARHTARGFSRVVFVEMAVGFVPVANELPLTLGAGLRLADIHEIWARAGYMPIGDDRGRGFGVTGYRVVLRPRHFFRPVFGTLFAALGTTCGHDTLGRPHCVAPPLFIFAGTAGARFEPFRWLGIAVTIALGVDSYPSPFGMIEIAASFGLPI